MPMTKLDIKALIREAELPEQPVPICLRTTLQHQYEDACNRLAAAEKANAAAAAAGTTSLAGTETVDLKAIADEIEAIREQMAEKTVTFRFHGLPRHRPAGDDRPTWPKLWAAHPPREDNAKDAEAGVNEETFFPALLHASLIDPEMDTDDWDELISRITDGQYELLCNVAWGLSRGQVSVPFSQAAWRIRATSATTSEQRSD